MENRELIQVRARVAYNPGYYDMLHRNMLLVAGYTPKEAKGLFGRTEYADGEVADYWDIALGDPADGVSNKTAQAGKINAMSLSLWKADELTYSGGTQQFKELNNAWFKRCRRETNFQSKLLEIDTDMPLGCSFSCVGIDEEGKANWRRYSPLKMLSDPRNRVPEESRYRITIDDYDIDQVSEKFQISKTELRNSGIARKKDIVSIRDRKPVYREDIYRVYRYWSRNHHCVIIGSLFGNKSIWLTLGKMANGELKYQRMQDNAGANPYYQPNPDGSRPEYGFIPIQPCYEMLIPGVQMPVGRLHWEAPIARMMQRIMAAIMKGIEGGGPMRILSSMGISEDTINKVKNNLGRFDETDGPILIAEFVEEAQKSVGHINASPIPREWLEVWQWLKQEDIEATGVSDAERGQRSGGEMTAYEFAGRQDAQGIQAKHARDRRSAFLAGTVSMLRTCAGLYDDRAYDLELQDGTVVNTGQFPLKPWLLKKVDIGITEDSLSNMGQQQKSILAVERFRNVDAPLMEKYPWAYDIPKALGLIYQEVYGVVDPQTRGLLPPDKALANRQSMEQQAAQQQAGQTLLEKAPEMMMPQSSEMDRMSPQAA